MVCRAAIRSLMSSTLQSVSGSSTHTSTTPGLSTSELRRISSPVLRSTTGTTGTPAFAARWKAPLRNGPSTGVAERVPSGKIISDVPPRIRSTTPSSVARAEPESERSM